MPNKLFTKTRNIFNAFKLANNILKKSNDIDVMNHPSWGDQAYENFGYRFATENSQLKTYTTFAWVAIAVDIIFQNVSGQQWYFEDDKGNELDISKIDKRITEPFLNGWAGNSISKMIGNSLQHRLLTGNALWWKKTKTLYGEYKNIKEVFIPIRPGYFKPIISQSGLFLKGYEIRLDDGQILTVPPEDVIHFKQNEIYSPYVGLGNIEKARMMFEVKENQLKYQGHVYKNRATPSVAITDEDETRNADDIRKMIKKLRAEYEGEKNAGKIMYYSAKGAKIESIAISQKDLQFLETNEFDRQTILSLFGIPLGVAGIPENTRANSKDARRGFLGNTINPYFKQYEETINMQHTHLIDRRVNFKIRKHLVGNVDEIKKAIETGVITPNMGAEMLGHEFDLKDESRNQYFLPSGLVPIGAEPVEETPPPEKPEPEEDNEEEDDEKKLKNKYSCCSKHFVELDTMAIDEICKQAEQRRRRPKKFQIKFLRKALEIRARTEKKYRGSLTRFFKDQAKRVIERMNDNLVKFTTLYMNAQNEKTFNVKQLEDEMVDLIFDKNSEDLLFQEEGKKLHTSTIISTILAFNLLTGAEVRASISNPAVQGMINQLGRQIVAGYAVDGTKIAINETSRKKIAGIILKGIEEGQTIAELQTVLQNSMTEFSPWRARMIGRTETRMACDRAAIESYKAVGVTKIDIVGCDMLETDSDCGKEGLPVDAMLNFHPNHLGHPVPSAKI